MGDKLVLVTAILDKPALTLLLPPLLYREYRCVTLMLTKTFSTLTPKSKRRLRLDCNSNLTVLMGMWVFCCYMIYSWSSIVELFSTWVWSRWPVWSMRNPGRETKNPSVTMVWGRLHNQPDTSNIQQWLDDTMKPLALETREEGKSWT